MLLVSAQFHFAIYATIKMLSSFLSYTINFPLMEEYISPIFLLFKCIFVKILLHLQIYRDHKSNEQYRSNKKDSMVKLKVNV